MYDNTVIVTMLVLVTVTFFLVIILLIGIKHYTKVYEKVELTDSGELHKFLCKLT